MNFKVFGIPLLAAVMCGCVAKYTQKIDFNTLEPLRVAVLPFVEIDSDGKVMDSDTSLLIDHVSVLSQDLNEKPRTLVRKVVQSELDNTALDMLAPALVNTKLMHNGFSDKDQNFDLPKIFATGAREYCTKVFDCDAVLYGKVTKWDRSYYGIQSSTTVAIELNLISARDGKTLYTATATDSDSRGITKIPTGFSDLVIEPIRGLDNDITIKNSAGLQFNATEFSSYRAEVNLAHGPKNPSNSSDPNEQKFYLQANFTIGAHPAHSY